MARYFYLAASLVELSLDKKPPSSFSQFLEEASVYLTEKDMKNFSVLREMIDIENIRRLLLEQEIDDRGNLNEKALDEAILGKVDLGQYAIDFLDVFNTTASRLEHFSAIYAGFFDAHKDIKNPFMKSYLNFEKEFRLYQAVLRSKNLGLSLSKVLQFEEPTDPLVMTLLVQSQNQELMIPQEFKKLQDIYNQFSYSPYLLYKKTEELRLSKINELAQDSLFKVDAVLAYTAALIIVEQWQSLSLEEGQKQFKQFTMKQ